MVVQGYENFEKMLVLGKDYGDRSGLGINSTTTNSTTHQGEESAFVKIKGKDHVPSQALK